MHILVLNRFGLQDHNNFNIVNNVLLTPSKSPVGGTSHMDRWGGSWSENSSESKP